MKKGTPLWKTLIFERRLPWRYNHLAGLFNTIMFVPLRRLYLPLILKLYNINKEEDVTIIIPIKNRPISMLDNTLNSLRIQNFQQKLIKIILVDYNSDKKFISKYKQICNKYNTQYIRINNKPILNLSHAKNIALKKIKTKYVFFTDTDIIHDKNYISQSIKELKKKPLQIIISVCLDLNKNIKDYSDYNELRKKSKCRTINNYPSPGIQFSFTYFYKKIRGWDEKYTGWGAQDCDMLKRFELLGLKITSRGEKHPYYHQWHPINKNKGKHFKIFKRNHIYLAINNSIKRNKNGWGNIN
jgi:predicted glycosyltransferase involved in capsule biosynthesis